MAIEWIDNFFKNLSNEDFLKIIEECGYGEIKSWSESDIELFNDRFANNRKESLEVDLDITTKG